MFEQEEGFPLAGDYVICTVSEIFPYGAMVHLDEYGLEGMVPIREISSSWVKNIRNHVKENQKIVCKVLRVDQEKRHIDLSLRKVTNQQKKMTIQRYKVKKKGNKLLEYFGTQNGIPAEQLMEIYNAILERYVTIYECFEDVVAKGKHKLEPVVPAQHVDTLYEIIMSNIESPLVEITGELMVTCPRGDGVNVIRDALSHLRDENSTEDVTVDIRLLGSPRYSVKIIAPDYKMAESALETVVRSAESHFKNECGTAEFKRSK
ncbi:MAG: translation initiation factor IF-2 subunit alpha [Candidatus Methanofastidiosa archaeon]|jgi:translation initiation factor 2 subunit 1|nr:translation initiation factor IF-2 subunit alpha [Candidatus Methanofastidiosa archaeon]MDD4281374.1 translation initiation factor IF-2 subunit alpha [Candidatus Methanofastidiosa archaeon]